MIHGFDLDSDPVLCEWADKIDAKIDALSFDIDPITVEKIDDAIGILGELTALLKTYRTSFIEAQLKSE